MTAALECSNLVVGYGKREILRGVTLSLQTGEAIALLGPNGGGKSTLLRTLSGLIAPISGSIRIQGVDLAAMNAKEIARQIAFVPQEESWQFAFSVEEVVAMGRLALSNGYFDTEEDREAAREAMVMAGCLDLRLKPVTELSGGERQRVLIARALAQATPIIFLDEPTAHLDPKFQVSTASLVRSLVKIGKSVLLAVHDLSIAGSMADRGVLIYDGTATEPQDIGSVLAGNKLDEAYSIEFDRIVTPSGASVVLPRPAG